MVCSWRGVVGTRLGTSALGALVFAFGCQTDGSARGADASSGESETDGPATTGDPDDPSDTSDEPDDDPLADYVPAGPVLPRLTATQYRNALVDLFGEDLPPVAVEADTNPYLFYSIGATSTTVSEFGVQQYEEAADLVANYVFEDEPRRQGLVGCDPVTPGDPCAESFIQTFGRRVYRRPLTDEEFARWKALATELGHEADVWEALRLVTVGMLQSPYFLYRVELGQPDPDDPTLRRYDGYEIASRLSFLFVNSIPDDELLDAAEAGDLDSADGIREHGERLLQNPRSRVAVQDFFSQFLDLGRLDGVERSQERYPAFTDTLPSSMQTEIELLVDDLVYRGDADVRTLFTTRNTFVNDELAALYGIEAPGANAVTFVPVELPEDGPRAGILTLGGFLAMNAHETHTSPTLRGKYVRERVLCQTIPAPPDDVDTSIDEDESDPKTLRELLEEHRANPACSSCHAFTDPPGFLFENFDSIGTYRTEDNGYPIDASGDLDAQPLANARELADLLAADERVSQCMVTQLFRHTNGRLEIQSEEDALEDIDVRFSEVEYRFRDLMVEFAAHQSFRIVSNVEVDP